MTNGLKQFTISDVAPGYWRMTFSNPPINLETMDTVADLVEIVDRIEADDSLKVVVIESAHPDYFFNHFDIFQPPGAPAQRMPSGLPPYIDAMTRLTNSQVVSIASIRGRTRGGGAEITAACDMRFASLERAIFGQPEVAAGTIPGGGALERLPTLVGRARALEIVLGSDDFDAATAAEYGWINRALPDADLDDFVDRLARRIASFDKPALTEAKRLLNRRTLPATDDLLETQSVFLQSFGWPTAKVRSDRMRQRINEIGPQYELRLGHYVAQLGEESL